MRVRRFFDDLMGHGAPGHEVFGAVMFPRLFLPALVAVLALATAPLHAQQTGAIAGNVVDKATGRPLAAVEINVVGTTLKTSSDLAGRFRFAMVPAGSQSVLARLIGYKASRQDSVKVVAGQSITLNVALGAAVLELASVEVVAEEAPKTSSSAGLLSLQQSAKSASDGLSAEIIAKAPDSDAGQAVARIAGISVVDAKYVVVRGLNERYNNALVNGVEVASPEPQKRIVPLDVFQSNLLESIVATKSATPDRPGDFAGASLDIKTKEFPSEFNLGVRVSSEYNSVTSFAAGLGGPRTFRDELSFGTRRRLPTSAYPTASNSTQGERFIEGLRNIWPTSSANIRPNTSASVSLGNSTSLGGQSQLGYVASVTYSNGAQTRLGRLYRVIDIVPDGVPADPNLRYRVNNSTDETEYAVGLGGIANVTARFGINNQISFKNFYTRSAEETYAITSSEIPTVSRDLIYPVRYIERAALQTQFAGDHRLFGGQLRAEWKASFSRATRDEPENRFVGAQVFDDGQLQFGLGGTYQFRFQTETARVGQVDLSVPVSFWNAQDGELKVGALRRVRARDFIGTRVQLFPSSLAGNDLRRAAERSRTPSELLSPEFVGQVIEVRNLGSEANAYASDDNVSAGYAMADVSLLPRLRFTGGARVEWWNLNLFVPGRPGSIETSPVFGGRLVLGDSTPLLRRNRDILPSVNLTYRLRDDMNIRLAGYQSISRPDARELSPEEYINLGGECPVRGETNLERTTIRNADAKWEWFPRAGEIFSIGGYYKQFQRPTITVFERSVSSGTCLLRFGQAREATVYGLELDLRRQLDFLPGPLRQLSIGANAALIKSEAVLDSIVFGRGFGDAKFTVPFAGQSNYLLNGSVSWDAPNGAFTASVLYNRFGDRVQNYGDFTDPNALFPDGNKDPDQIERARSQLDGRMKLNLGGGTAVTVSGRNLTNNVVLVDQFNPGFQVSDIVSRFRTGRSISFGVSHEF